MHELFAVCLLVVDRDSLDSPTSAPDDDPLLHQVESSQSASRRAMEAVLDRRYIEHDAYGLYSAIMTTGKSWYEWRQEEGPVRLSIFGLVDVDRIAARKQDKECYQSTNHRSV